MERVVKGFRQIELIRNVLEHPGLTWRALIYFTRRKSYVVRMKTNAAYVVPSIAAMKIDK
jgi:hypothetical protein